MSFQIHSPEGIEISLNALDLEACEFWKVEYDEKQYAHPNIENYYTTNWFDAIGWAIHHPGDYTKGWDDVKCTLWTIQARPLYKELWDEEALLEEIRAIRVYLAPYYELIDHWETKGYKPITIKD